MKQRQQPGGWLVTSVLQRLLLMLWLMMKE
jgi:hypothetical protein